MATFIDNHLAGLFISRRLLFRARRSLSPMQRAWRGRSRGKTALPRGDDSLVHKSGLSFTKPGLAAPGLRARLAVVLRGRAWAGAAPSPGSLFEEQKPRPDPLTRAGVRGWWRGSGRTAPSRSPGGPGLRVEKGCCVVASVCLWLRHTLAPELGLPGCQPPWPPEWPRGGPCSQS